MPPIHFGSATYKNLQINNKLETGSLFVNDALYIKDEDNDPNQQYINILDYAYNKSEFTRMPGVIQGSSTNIRKQIITPNDMSQDQQHIYKHVLNGCQLLNIKIRNSQHEYIPFSSVSIITLINDETIHNKQFNSNYNSILISEKFVHENNELQYIDIQFDNLVDLHMYGYLEWSTTIQNDTLPHISGYTLDNYTMLDYMQSTDSYILLTNSTFIYTLSNRNILGSTDIYGIKYQYVVTQSHPHVNITIHPHDGTLEITPLQSHIQAPDPIEIIASIKEVRNNTIVSNTSIKFYVADSAVTIDENGHTWLGNSMLIPSKMLIKNSTNSNLYIKDSNKGGSYITVPPFKNNNDIIIHNNIKNVLYTFNENSIDPWTSHSYLKYVPSDKNEAQNISFKLYTTNCEFVNVNSFIESPLSYYIPDISARTFTDISSGILSYTHRNPIAKMSFTPHISANSYWVQFFRNGYFTSSVQTDSITYLPFDYQSFQIVIQAENKNIKKYNLVNNFIGNATPILFIQNNSILFNREIVHANDKYLSHSIYHTDIDSDWDNNSINSFSVDFISFQSLHKDDLHVDIDNFAHGQITEKGNSHTLILNNDIGSVNIIQPNVYWYTFTYYFVANFQRQQENIFTVSYGGRRFIQKYQEIIVNTSIIIGQEI